MLNRGSMRRPRDAPGTPRDLRIPLWDPLWTTKNNHIFTNIQRQKLSIAVFETAHEGPSHEGVDRDVVSTKRLLKQKKTTPGISIRCVLLTWKPHLPVIY